MPKHNFKSKKKEGKSGNTFAIIFLVVIVAIGGGIFYMTATRERPDSNMDLPPYAYTTDTVTQAYAASSQMSDMFEYMPCYCGCSAMAHPVPHNSLRDCFHDEDGVWNQHAAECSTCVDIAMIVWTQLNEGKRPIDVRNAIDKQYSNGNYPPPTPTPLPPA